MLERAYTWMMDKARHDHAKSWLAAVSFAESSFFPLPPDLMLIPMVLADPKSWWRLTFLCTLTSVLGGFLGYAIGFWAMDTIGTQLLTALGLTEKFQGLKPMVDEYGVWLILIKGVIPIIPFKLVTIGAGAFQFDLMKFAVASVVARSMRFLPITLPLWWGGERLRLLIERRLKLVAIIALAALVGLVLVLKIVLA